ncbi:MAG: phosphatase PAP2 family protein [Lachnospiraceae bacterium]|nr:phosphatase PAP2 family protein [Lachnospiraceae bacterium]
MNVISLKKEKQIIVSEDKILLWIQENLRNDILTPILVTITKLGNHGRIWIATATILFLWRDTRMTGFLSFMALIGSMLINNLLLKRFIARIRPYEVIPELNLLIEKEKDLSFPSGHTGSAFAMATVLFFCLPPSLGIAALSFAALMGLTRLYVGAHYPTDVLAGGAIGSVIGTLIFLLQGLPWF